jgi:hypothetical protein
VSHVHLASLFVRVSRGLVTGHIMNAGCVHLDRIAEANLARSSFYQMVIVTASGRLLRLFRSRSNLSAC